MKDLLSLQEFQKKDLEGLLQETDRLKGDRKSRSLEGKTLGLIFQKPSMRTRVSFEVGMHQLGGYAITLGADEIQFGVRESVRDIAAVLSRYVDGIVARTFAHRDLVELARHASVPVINGLSDLFHPCQALGDFYTIWKKKGILKGLRVSYIGDGNNVLHSLLYGASLIGIHLAVATPKGYEPRQEVVKEAVKRARQSGGGVQLLNDPKEAASGADVVYTDVWTSMGQEKERTKRLKAFRPFQVNKALMKQAKKDAIFMHCLPAHRGEEVTEEVLDGERSVVLDQAENRLHVQKAILVRLLGRRS